MNIVLIGMAGSGKTTIGKKIAEKMQRQFVDMDKEVEKNEDVSISELVEKKGWDFFRKKEFECITQSTNDDNSVIATGGGVVLNKKNIVLLKKKGILFLLNTPLDVIIKRVKKQHNRPLFFGSKSIAQSVRLVFDDRKDAYLESADKIIDTQNKTVDQISDEIINVFTEKYDH